MRSDRIVVLGGGIVGLSAAVFLARRGVPVTVVERDALGEGASSGNAGILALAHPPLPKPGLLRDVLKLLASPTNPLYIAPRPDPALVRWVVDFLRACNVSTWERSMEILCRIGHDAGACFRSLVETEPIDCGYRPTGWLEVFRTPAGLDHGRRVADRVRPYGYRVDELDAAALIEREPAFRDDVHGALHYVDSAFADPGRFVEGLATAVQRRGGEVRSRSEVVDVDVRDARFRAVRLASGERIEGRALVLAAGAWTSAIARAIGARIPMQAGKGYHVVLEAPEARPSTTCVLAETFVAVTPLGEDLRLAGTVELSGLDLDRNDRRIDMLRVGARAYLRGIDAATVGRSWCGLRPLTADGLPAVGFLPGATNVYVATGHAMMGFLLGPLSGRWAAEALTGERDAAPFPELDVARYA